MNMKSVLAAVTFAAVAVASAAQASPISFTVTGTGSGTFGGTAFTDTNFEIDASADTANIGPFPGQPSLLFLAFDSDSMTLDGFATNGTVTPGLGIFEFSGGGGYIAAPGGSPAYNLIFGLPVFDLASNVAPTAFTPSQFNQFAIGFQVNGSQVNFSSMSNTVFSASTGGAAPEPASWALMLVGFGGLGASLRAARRRSVAA